MKTLVVDEITYGLLYTGLVISEAELNRKELRAIARITDTVEKYGEVQPNGIFKLTTTRPPIKEGEDPDNDVKEATIEIEDYDFAVLNKVIGHVKWKPIAARHLIKLFDMLDAGLKLEE